MYVRGSAIISAAIFRKNGSRASGPADFLVSKFYKVSHTSLTPMGTGSKLSSREALLQQLKGFEGGVICFQKASQKTQSADFRAHIHKNSEYPLRELLT